MYLFGILGALIVGGVFALLVRTELSTPGKTIVAQDTYNQFFTLHGAVMVFLVIIPGIPAALGNIIMPIQLGAPDVAFPRLNLASFYLWCSGALLSDHRDPVRGLDTGWTFYTPYSSRPQTPVLLAVVRRVPARVLVDLHRPQLPGDDPQVPPAGHGLVPAAAERVGDLRDRDHAGARDAGARHHGAAARRRAVRAHRHLRPDARRRPGAVPALLLVLLAPGGLHHDRPGDGRDQRADLDVLAQADLRLPVHRVLVGVARAAVVPGVGPPHVRVGPVAAREHGVLGADLHRRHPVGDQGLQLGRDAVQGRHPAQDADAVRAVVPAAVHDRRPDRPVPRHPRASTSTSTTPTSSSPTSTT